MIATPVPSRRDPVDGEGLHRESFVIDLHTHGPGFVPQPFRSVWRAPAWCAGGGRVRRAARRAASTPWSPRRSATRSSPAATSGGVPGPRSTPSWPGSSDRPPKPAPSSSVGRRSGRGTGAAYARRPARRRRCRRAGSRRRPRRRLVRARRPRRRIGAPRRQQPGHDLPAVAAVRRAAARAASLPARDSPRSGRGSSTG